MERSSRAEFNKQDKLQRIVGMVVDITERKRAEEQLIRRECLDHVIILNETGLRRILKSYFDYYEQTRTHLSFRQRCPDR